MQNLNKKTYRTIETQTDLPTNIISKLQNSSENINKTPLKLPQTQKLSQSNSTRLPLYKRNKPNIANTATSKQTRKSATEKSLPSIKSNNSTNPPIKKKKDLSTKQKRKKENSIQDDSSVLSLHPTDPSENEDDMSTNSDEGNPDTYI